MNFLAHLYLSGEDEELLIGNFIADYVKGSLLPGSRHEGFGLAILKEFAFTDTSTTTPIRTP